MNTALGDLLDDQIECCRRRWPRRSNFASWGLANERGFPPLTGVPGGGRNWYWYCYCAEPSRTGGVAHLTPAADKRHDGAAESQAMVNAGRCLNKQLRGQAAATGLSLAGWREISACDPVPGQRLGQRYCATFARHLYGPLSPAGSRVCCPPNACVLTRFCNVPVLKVHMSNLGTGLAGAESGGKPSSGRGLRAPTATTVLVLPTPIAAVVHGGQPERAAPSRGPVPSSSTAPSPAGDRPGRPWPAAESTSPVLVRRCKQHHNSRGRRPLLAGRLPGCGPFPSPSLRTACPSPELAAAGGYRRSGPGRGVNFCGRRDGKPGVVSAAGNRGPFKSGESTGRPSRRRVLRAGRRHRSDAGGDDAGPWGSSWGGAYGGRGLVRPPP